MQKLVKYTLYRNQVWEKYYIDLPYYVGAWESYDLNKLWQLRKFRGSEVAEGNLVLSIGLDNFERILDEPHKIIIHYRPSISRFHMLPDVILDGRKILIAKLEQTLVIPREHEVDIYQALMLLIERSHHDPAIMSIAIGGLMRYLEEHNYEGTNVDDGYLPF